jgi:phage gp36-like protein
MFASRADLLARSNASRLSQLAIPADRNMVDEAALRLAIDDGNLSAYSADDVESLTLAMAAIDNALADADALILSYGIPDTVQTSLLARMCSTIALYYLQGAERMSDDVQKAYDATIKMLEQHAKGLINLIPSIIAEPGPGMGAEITSNPTRYGGAATGDF